MEVPVTLDAAMLPCSISVPSVFCRVTTSGGGLPTFLVRTLTFDTIRFPPLTVKRSRILLLP
jgi:hypothetical protein